MKIALCRAAFQVVLLCAAASSTLAQGGNFPITSGAAPEVSLSAAWDGARYLVGTRGHFAQLGEVGAHFVAPDAQLGPYVSTGRTGGPPFVAIGGGQYLLAYDDSATFPQDEIYALFVQPDGSHGALLPVCVDGTGKFATGLAYTAGKFLVTYGRDNALLGRLITSPASIGPELVISNSFFAGKTANNVAANGTRFLVAWTDELSRNVVNARFVQPDGALSASFSVDVSSAPSDDLIAVASNGTSFLVVYPEETGGAGSGEWDLYAQALTQLGNPLGARQAVCAAAGWQFAPFVASDGLDFVVTWTDLRNDMNKNFVCEAGEATCWDIWGRSLAADGVPLNEPWPLVERAGDQFASPLAFGGGKYLMAWTDGAIADDGGDVYGLFLPRVPVAITFCTAKVNSAGCTPHVHGAGVPSATGNDPFEVRAANVLANVFGLCFYGKSGPNNVPFKGGTLCALQPVQRTPIQTSGGDSLSSCSGTYAFDFNAWVRSGIDPQLVPGQVVWLQYWYRDRNSTFTLGLTDALEFAVGP